MGSDIPAHRRWVIDGRVVTLTQPQADALSFADSGDSVQANVIVLRSLRDMGLVVDIDYILRDQRPFATFTRKAKEARRGK